MVQDDFVIFHFLILPATILHFQRNLPLISRFLNFCRFRVELYGSLRAEIILMGAAGDDNNVFTIVDLLRFND